MSSVKKIIKIIVLVTIGIVLLCAFFLLYEIIDFISCDTVYAHVDSGYIDYSIPNNHAGLLLRKKVSGESCKECKLFFWGGSFSVVYNNSNEFEPTYYETVNLGRYTQNSNEEEPIEWLIIDEKNGRKLLLSRYYLDAVTFGDQTEDITWESSYLREWLNDEFYNSAFNEQEKRAICESKIVSDYYPCNWDEDDWDGVELPSKITYDKVFVLDSHEKLIYLCLAGNDYQSEPTKFAKQHAYIFSFYGEPIDAYADWTRFAYVPDIGYQVYWSFHVPLLSDWYDNGDYHYHTMNDETVNSALYVRPAIWVDSDYLNKL